MLDCRHKILNSATLGPWRAQLRQEKRRLVVTNGCFDILHFGHVSYLEKARNLGDVLLLGINSDESVRSLKGPGRPVNSEQDRAGVLAGLESVSGVFIFTEVRAVAFLEKAAPDIYVKGADYTIDTIPQEERRIVEGLGGKIRFIDFVPEKSTSLILKKIESMRRIGLV